MAAPLVFAIMLMLAMGVLAFLIWRGGSISGPEVHFSLEGDCAVKAQRFIDSRMKFVLGDSYGGSSIEGNGITIQTRLHDHPNIEESFPLLVARKGTMDVRGNGVTLATRDDVTAVSLELNESGVTYVSVQFKDDVREKLADHVAQDPDGELAIYLDGELAVRRPNSAKIPDDEFKIISDVGDARARSLTAANRALVLKHGPLPCDLTPRAIEPTTVEN